MAIGCGGQIVKLLLVIFNIIASVNGYVCSFEMTSVTAAGTLATLECHMAANRGSPAQLGVAIMVTFFNSFRKGPMVCRGLDLDLSGKVAKKRL